jgi:predicted KAP-like P-loop ATPase
VVSGFLGAWGVGEASLIDLIVAALKEEPRIDVISFKPWMFSGADQLLDAFFTELGEQLKGEVAERYSTGWRPEQ